MIGNVCFSESSARGWELMLFFCSFVSLESALEPYLRHHLLAHSDDRTKQFYEVARDSMTRLNSNKAGARLLPPSMEEYECFEVRFSFNDSTCYQKRYIHCYSLIIHPACFHSID